MNTWQEFTHTTLSASAADRDESTGRIQRFGTLEDEYRMLHKGAALLDRDYAGVLEITGDDRSSWLHNLTTNQVKNLGLNEGVYAFALNVQGRILFDLHILNLGDRIWCIINHSFIENAIAHFDRYVIMEDVAVRDRGSELVRLGLSGPAVSDVLDRFGIGNAGALASPGVALGRVGETDVVAARTDFCGTLGIDLLVPSASAIAVWNALSDAPSPARAAPVGDAVVEISRIEAGLPCPLRELSQDVLPAETGQFDRAVSFTKGCYLGQEIVERMRSRSVVARLLSGVKLDGAVVPPSGAIVQGVDGSPIGSVTSSCRSLALGIPIALAYRKAGANGPESPVRLAWDDGGTPRDAKGTVVSLPFVGVPVH